MEQIPCSNVGHIYREFDRFGVDPKLNGSISKVDWGKVLSVNDARVAEVWMDDYKAIFYEARGLQGLDVGDVSARVAMRQRLQCKSFAWFLREVHPKQFVPDLHPVQAGLISPRNSGRKQCLDTMTRLSGAPGLYGCHGHGNQRWILARDGRLSTDMLCLTHREDRLQMITCHQNLEPDSAWVFLPKTGQIAYRNGGSKSKCIDRTHYTPKPGTLKVTTCNIDSVGQSWDFSPHKKDLY